MDKGHGERLSRDQERAIAALLVSPTVVAAAEAIGAHPNTVRGWIKLPAFAAAYKAVREEHLEHAAACHQEAVTAAFAALVKDLASKTPSVRHKAAELILTHGYKSTEIAKGDETARKVASIDLLLKEVLARGDPRDPGPDRAAATGGAGANGAGRHHAAG